MGNSSFSRIRNSFSLKVIFGAVLSNLLFWGQPLQSMILNNSINFTNYTKPQGSNETDNSDIKSLGNTLKSIPVAYKAPASKTHYQPEGDSYSFSARQTNGTIGILSAEDTDDGYDNLFTVTLPADFNSNVYDAVLSYELFGIAEAWQTTKSINNASSYGGKAVTLNSAWTQVAEHLPDSQLKAGVNQVYFNRRVQEEYQYKVRNLKIVLKPSHRIKSEVVLNTVQNLGGSLLISGTVNNSQINNIKVLGQEVSLADGIFETIINNVDQDLNNVQILYYNNGELKSLDAPVNYKTDPVTYTFKDSKLSEQVSIFNLADLKNESAEYAGLCADVLAPAVVPGAMLQVQGLKFKDIKILNPDLENVTYGTYGGYRVKKFATPDSVAVQLHIKYDPALIPDGYTAKDIRPFYFDNYSRDWKALPVDSLNYENNEIVTSIFNNETDYLTGVIKIPDSPETGSYAPTTISDMKYADPTAGVVSIPPPSANSTGTATTSFPIKLPAGRGGMQPSLQVSYSSEGGNGWMGVGWNLSTSAITLNTKWGAPLYTSGYETEMYALDGSDLVLRVGIYTTPNRQAIVRGNEDKIFYQRKEGGFNKIIRHGSSPAEYFWEVIDKSGTKTFYGGITSVDPGVPAGVDNNAVLKTAAGIGHWAIRRVQDVHGNYIDYQYEKSTTIVTDSIEAQQLYLSKIQYTRNINGLANYYEVRFARNTNSSRSDVVLSAKNGYFEVVKDLLTDVSVWFITNNTQEEPIRSYKFSYEEKDFKKQQLVKISEYDASGDLFYSNTMEYFTMQNQSSLSIIKSDPAIWSGDNDEFQTSLPSIPGYPPAGSALGTSSATGASFGLRVGLGLGLAVWSISKSAGISGNYSANKQLTRISMLDINGDGLPDKVVDGSSIYYRPNTGSGFGNPLLLSGLNELSITKSRTFGGGLDATFGPLSIGKSWSTTKSDTDNYFTDFNGDGLVDIAMGGLIKFNQSGYSFNNNVATTPNPINSGGISQAVVQTLKLETLNELREQNPQFDHVKVWEAPMSGTVKITGTAKVISNSNPTSSNQFRFTILRALAGQISGTAVPLTLDSNVPHRTLQSVNSTASMNVSSVAVNKGDKLFFRIHNPNYGNGGQLEWDPNITYTSGSPIAEANQNGQVTFTDDNNKYINYFDAKQDFIVNNDDGIAIKDGTSNLTLNFNILNYPALAFSDNLNFNIKVYTINPTTGTRTLNTAYYANYDHITGSFTDNIASISSPFSISLNSSIKYYIVAYVESTSNVRWDDIKWRPTLRSDNTDFQYIPANYTIFNENVNQNKYWFNAAELPEPVISTTVPSDSGHNFIAIDHDLFTQTNNYASLIENASSEPLKINWVIKQKTGTALAKVIKGKSIYVRKNNDGSISFTKDYNGTQVIVPGTNSDYEKIYLTKAQVKDLRDTNAIIFAAFYINNREMANDAGIAFNLADPTGYNYQPIRVAKPFFSTTADVFGLNYRGWNQFLYNGGIKLQHNAEGDVEPNAAVFINYGISDIEMKIFDFEHQQPAANENTTAEELTSDETMPRYTAYKININNSYYNSAIIGAAYNKDSNGQVTASVGRFGEANLYNVYVDPVTILLGGSNVFVGLKQRSESKGSALTAGAAYVNGTESKATSNVLNQYMDLNGDNYPDLVTGGLIQYTNMLGALSSKQEGNNFMSGDDSIDRTVGVTIPSTPSNSTNTSKTTGNKTNTNISSGINTSEGESFNSRQWADMNGDGLTDKVELRGNQVLVSLNTGYNFTGQIVWFAGGTQYPSSKRGNSIGVSFGFSSSFAVGFGAATSTANMQTMLVDINGDGLPELLVNDNNIYKYHLNRGDRFEDQPITFFNNYIEQDTSTSSNVFASYTFGIPIPLLLVNLKVVFTPSIGVNNTLSKKTCTLQDINGDGYVDVISSASRDDNGSVIANLNQINKTYLLKKVNTALGGSWELDYARTGNTYNMPHSKWTLTSIITNDGFIGDTNLRPDATVTSIAYENPHYNRRQREFFGFQTVTVKQHDPTGSRPVFRSIKYTYHNENYYLSGLLKATATYNSANQLLSEENTLYNLLDPDGPVVNFNAAGNCMQASLSANEAALLDRSRLFVAMARSTTSSYEGSQRIWTTKSIMEYDLYGNILTYTYSGADAYKAVITYQNNANFRAKYMMGLPKKISIYDSDGTTLMRERNATCDLMGKMSKILVRLSNSYNTINFEYDSYGNMTKVIEFENRNSTNTDPYEKNITYDDKVFTYPVTVGNSFGEVSSTQYNYLFGIPVFSTDINGKSMRTRIDDRGRVVEVTGPNELVTGPNAWTIRMQYKNETPLSNSLSPTQFVVNANRSFVAVAPGATNPINAEHYAVTRHFDPEYAPPGSPVSSNELVTISIADGFGKALQVKKTHQVGSTMKWLISGFEKQDAFGRTLTSYLPAVQESYPSALGAYSSTDTGYYLPYSSLQTSAEMLYDAKDRVVRIKQPSVSATQTPPMGENEFAQINYSISDNLVVEKLTNERGQTMETFTDSNGRQRKTVQNGQITTLYEYNAVNELIKVIDNQDAVTEYKYDLGGRKLEVRHPDRGVTLFKYDIAGRLIQQSNSNLQLAGGRFINYYYNFGRLVRIAYPQNPQNEVKYTYGAPGTSAAQINAVGRVMYQEDATGIQVFGYGNMGEVNRNLRSVAVAGYQSYWFYTTWKYDSWNRVQEIVYPDQEKVMYSYNKAGMLQGINSQIGLGNNQDIVRSITYNDLGERTVLEHGNDLKTYYTYDARSRLSTLKQVFAGSREITKKYEYDGLSNITSVKTVTPQNILPEPGEIGGAVDHTYTYDNYNRLFTARGSYTGASDTGATPDLTMPYLKQTYQLNMEYNIDHTLKRKVQKHTQALTSSYNGGTTNSIPVLKTNYDLQYSDYATGAFVVGPDPNSSYGYQQPHAVRTIIEAPAGVSNIAPDDPRIRKKTITYDANGNQKELKEKVGDFEFSLRKNLWDEENQLMGVDLKPDQALIHPIAAYTYNASGERTIRYNMDRMDASSNATRQGAESLDNIMIYPSGLLMGKVKHITDKGIPLNRMTYTKHYYIGAERISAKTGTMADLGLFPEGFINQPNTGLPQLDITTIRATSTASVADAEILLKKVYTIFLQTPPVLSSLVEDKLKNTNHDGLNLNIYYFHPDHLGSSSYITNGLGNVIQHMEYLPFGETLVDEHINSFSSPFKFNGKEHDEETGNYYYGARYYDPKLSIFISVDPLAEKYPDYSPYAYCINNPLNVIDPDGRDIIILNHGPRGKTSVDGGKTNAHKHVVGHQAVLIGNNKTGWTYMSYDYDKGENNGKRTNKNDNYTITKFKSLDEFKNSEHNTFKEDYDDGKGLATSHKTADGKIIQRYENAFQITSDASTDAKMIIAADNVFNEPWSELNGTFNANQCTTVAERALNAGGFNNGEYTKYPGDIFRGTANYLPAAKQKEIERSNKGIDIDKLIKRTIE